MSSINFSTFVFFDAETSGILSSNYHPRITELALLALDRSELINGVTNLPVMNKLILCFNPMMPMQPKAAQLSGLNADNLSLCKDFDGNAVQAVDLFLRRHNPPICLVAHNGYNFDFRLIRSELSCLNLLSYEFLDAKGQPVYCGDSLLLFRNFDYFLISSDAKGLAKFSSQVIKSQLRFSLPMIYESVFGKSHDLIHTAEGDCLAVMNLVQFLGERALSWFENNHKRLIDIPEMY
ncbi:hypothetical protein Aperf_G00000023464 [Anoplocephala perfoliata]